MMTAGHSTCASDKHTQELAELKSAMAALILEVEQLKYHSYVETNCAGG